MMRLAERTLYVIVTRQEFKLPTLAYNYCRTNNAFTTAWIIVYNLRASWFVQSCRLYVHNNAACSAGSSTRDIVLRDRFSRVECPLKSVQYQFAPMFITVVFNPLAPGSGTGRAINLSGVPLCRAQDKISSRCVHEKPVRLTTDPDR